MAKKVEKFENDDFIDLISMIYDGFNMQFYDANGKPKKLRKKELLEKIVLV